MANNASPNIVERSFQLARSGTCAGTPEIRLQLKAEGYENIAAHFGSLTLKATLSKLCREAHGEPERAPPRRSAARLRA